ncbi:MAG: hypothetical protein ACLGIN_00815 [Candidatus Sericytochromatia bacterium]
MKKDDALALRERLRALAAQQAPELADDGKLYHDEVDGTARWAQRLSRPDAWPHLGPDGDRPACPGLRYEVWFFQGKAADETVWLMALVDEAHGLEPLARHLAPTFKTLIEGGKYARRYQALPALVTRFHPGTTGICRQVPVKKLDEAFKQLLTDTIKPIASAFSAWEGAPSASAAFAEACASFDPLAALKKRFG